jgi:phage gpG-like protein
MTFPGFTIGENFQAQIALLSASVDRMAMRFEDAGHPLRQALNDVILPSIDANFATGGRPAWKPLAKSTVAKRGSGEPILIRSGALRAAATSPGNWEVTRDTLQMVGISVSYGPIHQGGAPRASIPARPFVLYQPKDEFAIEKIFALWIDTIVAETWNLG